MHIKRVILDTDIGKDVDDAIAIVLALSLPNLKIEAITTSYGNVEIRSRMALKLLKLTNKLGKIPVANGAPFPLLREVEYSWSEHEGKGILDQNDGILRPIEQHAIDLIIDLVMKNQGKITIIAIGPLTNIALAIRKDSRIIKNIKELIVVAGTARIFGLSSDFPESYIIEPNVRCDPEAAAIVFSSGIPITMIGTDVTTKVPINRTHLEIIKKINTPLMKCMAEMIEIFWNFTKNKYGWSGNESLMYDPLGVAVCAYPELVDTERCRVIVETSGKHTIGQTIVIPWTMKESKWQKRFVENNISKMGPKQIDGLVYNVEVAYKVNSEKFINMLIDKICSDFY